MRKAGKVTAVVAAAIVLGSCTGTNPPSESVPGDAHTKSPERVASVGQYARIIGRDQDEIGSALNEVDDCLYRYDFQAETLDCNAAPLVVRSLTRNLKSSLSQAKSTFGQPPSQVTDEVRAIEQSSAELLRAIDAWVDADCRFDTNDQCDLLFMRMSSAGGDFGVAVDAWN